MISFPNSILRVSLIAAVAATTFSLGGCKKDSGATGVASIAQTPAVPNTPEARKAAKTPYTRPPAIKKNLYPSIEDGPKDVQKALSDAKRTHKRVLIDFGGDWCGDCQVLDIYFNQAPNKQLLEDNYVKVNVNIGQEDANVDLAHKYGVPLHGVPALAVLDSNGKVLYSQNKEFSDMRYMEPQSVTDFLNKWKQ